MSAFESSHITARVQKALFKRMLAVNRLVPNSVEKPGVGSADNLKQSLLTGQAFIPRDIIGDNNPFEQQILRSVFCKYRRSHCKFPKPFWNRHGGLLKTCGRSNHALF